MTTLLIEPVASLLPTPEVTSRLAVCETVAAGLPTLPDLFAETRKKSAALDESIAWVRKQIVRTFQSVPEQQGPGSVPKPVVADDDYDPVDATLMSAAISANGALSSIDPFVARHSLAPAVVAPVLPDSQDSRLVMSQAVAAAAQSVADTLAVTPGPLHGRGTVTIQLKDSVLGGAQVTVSTVGRQLEVSFSSASASVSDLIERNLPQIQQHLGLRIRSFSIDVKLHRTRG